MAFGDYAENLQATISVATSKERPSSRILLTRGERWLVTLYDNSDNSLLGTLGNGVNNYLLDTPQYLRGPLKINTNGRNGKPAFNTINNFDMTLKKNLRLTESRSLEIRAEAFNAFNHAQFYGPASVDGQVEDPNFRRIIGAAAPRLVQLVAKFNF